VTVLGASGGIGQPLSMLLKLSPYIHELACYDIANTPGVAADLSHVREAMVYMFIYMYIYIYIIYILTYYIVLAAASFHFVLFLS
jgi:malate/lactate dehydrogenase